MEGRTAIAKILKQEGVEFVTGFPRNSLHEALAEEGIRFIKFRTESRKKNPLYRWDC